MTNTEKLIQDLETSIKFQQELQADLFKEREIQGYFSVQQLDVLKNSYISELAMCKAKYELIRISVPEYLKEDEVC